MIKINMWRFVGSCHQLMVKHIMQQVSGFQICSIYTYLQIQINIYI